MEQKTRIVIIATLTVVIAASGLILTLQTASANPSTLVEDELQFTQDERRLLIKKLRNRFQIMSRFVKNGEPKTLEGSVSATTRFILILNEGGESINVLVPRYWIVDGEKLEIHDLFDGDPFSINEEASLETLMLELEKDTHNLTSYLAYTIQIEGDTATALLPFNIEVD